MTTLNTMLQTLPELDPTADNMPSYVKRYQDRSTPFKVIEFGIYEIRLYWTSNAGAYGYQVIAVVFGKTGYCFSRKTNGYGYCKESDTMDHLWSVMGYHPRKNSYFHDTINYDYKIGGNFYRVPMRDILKNKTKK